MAQSRLLVFGDIHGAISSLSRLLQRLMPTEDDTLLFLGDYIDRGEDSRAVLDLLSNLEQLHSCIFLMGNHEDMFLKAYSGAEADLDLWLNNGGLKTFLDFDGGLPPDRHVEWIRRLRPFYETETHYFVHAGLRPGVAPSESTDMERLWIREPFLSSTYDWGKRVIFGHTVQFGGPLVMPNKIGIDTGAFIPRIGRLTCLALPEGRFVFSRGRSKKLG
ncbi:MAG: metallophosphoesterase [Chloroflexi bacterium]|jgi:serine/threonine protein phosphatase 1|nr:metallophosphoesterase [Chloroflexota bacterium]